MNSIFVYLFEKIRIERLLAIPYGWVYRILFRKFGRSTFVSPFVQTIGIDCIQIGSQSKIGRNTRLLALRQYGDQKFEPLISIGDNVSVGFGCTLSCVNKINIENDVTIGDNVYIADSHHDYRNPRINILNQPLLQGCIDIGKGAWIGYGAFVAGNVSVGEHSVIGANSVVTRTVPPFTVVAGVPAMPIKVYDWERGGWVRIQKNSIDWKKI